MRSVSPSSSRVSVAFWSSVTARSGALSKVSFRPQLMTVVTPAVAVSALSAGAEGPVEAEQPAVERAMVRAMPRWAGWRMGSSRGCGQGVTRTGRERSSQSVL